MAGTLYVVATPIGNLSDITDRAKKTLRKVSCIFCEDTRESKKILNVLDIKKPLLSLFSGNENFRSEEALNHLQKGKDIALISDAGTPNISDPGYALVSACYELGIRVSPIPGASSIIAALSTCGLPTTDFRFIGFFPQKAKKRQDLLKSIKNSPSTLVFFESPRRIKETLTFLANHLPKDHRLHIAREITKVHETLETKYLADWQENGPTEKGEFVCICEPCQVEYDIHKRFQVFKEGTTLSDKHIMEVLALEYDTSPKRIKYKLQ